jgi:hypothetical protein
MSAAADRVITALNARRIRDGEYRARCPVHQGKSDGSLSIRDAGDRALIHCHAGCRLSDILTALGLSTADLFNESRNHRPFDPGADLRAQAQRGFEMWREKEMMKAAEELRWRDELAMQIDRRVRSGQLEHDLALAYLRHAYIGYEELEREFQILSAGTELDALELYRERKRKTQSH